MNLDTAILTRRSIRSFSNKPVSKVTVDSLIEAAILAPSAGNKQGWQFIIVDSDEIKEYISEHTLSHYDGDAGKALERPRKYAVEDVVSHNVYTEHNYHERVYPHPKLIARLHHIQLSLDRNKKPTIARWLG